MGSNGEDIDVVVGRMKLGSQGLEVSRQGLGCMGMSGFYGPQKPEFDMIELIHYAISQGITHLDTSDVYGPHTNEILLGKALLSETIRHKVQLATKFGLQYKDQKFVIHGDPEYVRACCEDSLKRLRVDQHRIDTKIPIEITMRELKKLVNERKIKYIGLSEASASTIRRAHAVHPITAVQLEWSLWTRDKEEELSLLAGMHFDVYIYIFRELGIGIVCYSPLGRGFLAAGAKLANALSESDYRKGSPRFQKGNSEQNDVIFQRVSEMAKRKGCTPSQLALAWLHHQGPDVCPIPGTTKIQNLKSNIKALSVKLTSEEMSELESYASVDDVKGDRYVAHDSSWYNTPPLSSWKSE